MLLGTELESQTSTCGEIFPEAGVLPSTPPHHGHEELNFPEVANRAGEARLKLSKGKIQPYATADREPPAQMRTDGQAEDTTAVSVRQVPRSTQWYPARAIQLDAEREQHGQPPVKRHRRMKDFYACGKCRLPKNKETGHRQCKGRWFCPREGVQYDDWKASLPQKPPNNDQE